MAPRESEARAAGQMVSVQSDADHSNAGHSGYGFSNAGHSGRTRRIAAKGGQQSNTA